ncbi:hypothetical protein [Psychromonas antarctica]|uniref:hypothetical protein n=1 Tax=Psychromonas antarctica TaxID=67573 RepID=UPI001EE78409|nr:hypothetical protein [Psychromonas antarctica]MCG6202325.1 hypothetical protein [Psychromonas antarctica]
MEQKFTYEDFKIDVKQNHKMIIDEGIVKLQGSKIYPYIGDDQSINAKATRSAPDQYIITINEGVLKAIFSYSTEVLRPFYKIYHANLGVTEELFIRFVCGIMSDFIFWHELSHIARGHFKYLGIDQYDTSLGFNLDKISESRIVEIDADIFGASYLFLRVLSVINSGSIRAEDALCAYTVGIRSIFEILHIDNVLEDYNHRTNEHPHSQARAFNAYAFGVASPEIISYKKNILPYYQECAQQFFIDFESLALGNKFNIDAVAEIMPVDVDKWHSEKAVLDSLSIMSYEKRSMAEKRKSLFREITNKLRNLFFPPHYS